jgi:hypothetical protein
MRLKLVILFALLLDLKLKQIVPELHAQAEAMAKCSWNRDFDAMAIAVGSASKTCTWILAGPHGRPGEVWTLASKVMLWLDESIRAITTAS